jgi:hypothetical protein
MKILMVLTSHDQLGDTGRKTGFWLKVVPFLAEEMLKQNGAHQIARNNRDDKDVLKACYPISPLASNGGNRATIEP